MSNFSDVDASGAVASLASYLSATDSFLAAMKSYMTEAAAGLVPLGGVVADIGCGLGYDLERLAARGLLPIGVDASAHLLDRARTGSAAPLVRADAARLPFLSGALDGCRIERTLQHVTDPSAVLAEVVRVLRPGGFIAVFDADFETFRVDSEVVPDGSVPARLHRVRHPRIGSEVAALLEVVDCRVRDVVTESSRSYRLDDLPLNAERLVRRAVVEGSLDPRVADLWLIEQCARTGDGTFRAQWDKILVVATKVDRPLVGIERAKVRGYRTPRACSTTQARLVDDQ